MNKWRHFNNFSEQLKNYKQLVTDHIGIVQIEKHKTDVKVKWSILNTNHDLLVQGT